MYKRQGSSYADWAKAQALSEVVRWQRPGGKRFAWVERQSFEQAAVELELDLANTQSLSLGQWLHANLIVAGSLTDDQGEQGLGVHLDIIEPATGGIVVSDFVALATDKIDLAASDSVVSAMHRLLIEAEAALREEEADKVLRLVHISNLTGSARMDQIAWDLSDRLAEIIKAKPGIRLARTQRTLNAAQEGALSFCLLYTSPSPRDA